MRDEMFQLLASSGGFSRTNNYRVELSLPQDLSDYQEDLENIQLACSAIQLPGIGLETTRAKNGPSLKPDMAVSSHQQEIDLNFYVSKSFVERRLFRDWVKLTIDDETQIANYYDNYIGQIWLYPMKRGNSYDDGSLVSCQLINAYPKTIGSISYSYDSEGQIAILPVSFTFFRHELTEIE